MLKSILVGLDGSPYSAVAVELGIQWAKHFHALVVGLGIVNDRAFQELDWEPSGGSHYPLDLGAQLLAEGRQKVKQLLEQFAEQCVAADVAYNLLQDVGLPYEEILRESERYDLVLLGHEGHFRLATEGPPDETLWNVLKREPRPVVIAPLAPASGASVVVAYNGSPQADRALQAFESSGLDLEEEVCVFSADDDREEATRQADRAVEFLRLHRINAVPHALGPVDLVSQSILEEVRRRSARLLVMGAYGHSTVREFLLGSTTKAVLKESPVPVFLCH
jgi:nucleotide-binding universal stress UspA family protein